VFISARVDTYLNKWLMPENEMITVKASLKSATADFSFGGVSFFAYSYPPIEPKDRFHPHVVV
jgi:hypothetical protein